MTTAKKHSTHASDELPVQESPPPEVTTHGPGGQGNPAPPSSAPVPFQMTSTVTATIDPLVYWHSKQKI